MGYVTELTAQVWAGLLPLCLRDGLRNFTLYRPVPVVSRLVGQHGCHDCRKPQSCYKVLVGSWEGAVRMFGLDPAAVQDLYSDLLHSFIQRQLTTVEFHHRA